MKTAKQYYDQVRRTEIRNYLDGLSMSCTFKSNGTTSRLYSEEGTNRWIDITEVYNDYSPYSLTVQIFPSYTYYENYCIEENKGSRIETFTNN